LFLNVDAKDESHWPPNQFAEYYRCDVVNPASELVFGMSLSFTVVFEETHKEKGLFIGDAKKLSSQRIDSIDVPTLNPNDRFTFYVFNGTQQFVKIAQPEMATLQRTGKSGKIMMVRLRYPTKDGRPGNMSLGPRPSPTDVKPAQTPPKSAAHPTFARVLGNFVVIAGGRQYQPGAITVFGEQQPAISAYVDHGDLFVDAQLYSTAGRPPLELVKNKLMAMPPQWDTNFDSSAIEVVDEQGKPRFQLIYHDPHTVFLRGIFQFENRVVVIEEKNQRFAVGSTLAEMETKRLFKYPSRLFQGQEMIASAGAEPAGVPLAPPATIGNLRERARALAHDIMDDLYRHGWHEQSEYFVTPPTGGMIPQPQMPRAPKEYMEWTQHRSLYFRFRFLTRVRDTANEFSQLHLRDRQLDNFLDSESTLERVTKQSEAVASQNQTASPIEVPITAQQIQEVAERLMALADQLKQ